MGFLLPGSGCELAHVYISITVAAAQRTLAEEPGCRLVGLCQC